MEHNIRDPFPVLFVQGAVEAELYSKVLQVLLRDLLPPHLKLVGIPFGIVAGRELNDDKYDDGGQCQHDNHVQKAS